MPAFRTDSLSAAAYLASQGHLPTGTEGSGTAVVLVFALSVEDAQRLLDRPEHRVCEAYHRGLRHVRRLIDQAQSNGGRR